MKHMLHALLKMARSRDTHCFAPQVDYRERMYAVGRIPGRYLRREGQPSEHETGIAAAVMRALRPHLPQHMAEPLDVCNCFQFFPS